MENESPISKIGPTWNVSTILSASTTEIFGAQDTYRLLSNTDGPDLTRRAVTAIV
jgi:hypothetical protein